MARYIRAFIDADNLRVELGKLCERFNISFGEESQGFGKALSELPENLPAADVCPERHGRWIYNTDDFTPALRCSVCGYNKPEIAGEKLRREPENYCANCGAKMDGKDVT